MKNGQYAGELSYHGEHAYNMNGGSKAFIADAARASHSMMIEAKVINETSLSERKNSVGPKVDVTKNFSRLPKSQNDPQPNDAGQPVYDTLYKKSAGAGMAKGGIKYGKG